MKKVLGLLFIILVLCIGSFFVWEKIFKYKVEPEIDPEEEKIKNAKIEVTLKDNMVASFYSKVKVSDFITSINGVIVDDYLIDTEVVGDKKVEFEFVNDEDIKVPYSYDLKIIDEVPPSVWLGNNYYVNKGYKGELSQDITCVDDYDDNPVCMVTGSYNPDVVGDYNMVFEATDSSGNKTTKNFVLSVVEPKSGGGSSSNKRTPFEDVQSWYKDDNTMIGIDISEWQRDVDFEALKNAGVEFAILRVGGTKGIDGEYFLDARFKRNIEGFNEIGIPVGIYFYSYAKTKEAAISDAKWLLEQIDGYKIDLPIAYDWENWSFLNEFHNSFYTLTRNARAFLDTVRDAGYQGMLYSSKNYLEKAWLDVDYTHWLAHYNETTNYAGEYTFWQICSNGKVAGVNGNVDIDIWFTKKEDNLVS